MVLRISRSMAVGDNRFDVHTAFGGWVNESETYEGYGFFTSDYIPVQQGDVICFAPAVCYQGWHLVVYDAGKAPFRQVDIHSGVEILETLDSETAVMQYRVDLGVAYIRVICDVRYVQEFLVTKNRTFTAEDYRSQMVNTAGKAMTHVATHNADCWTVVMNEQGTGTMTAGKKEIAFSPGTVVCVPPGIPFEKYSGDGFSDIHLCCDSFAPGENATEPLVCTDDENQGIQAILQLIFRFFWEPEGHYRRLVEQLYITMEQLILYRLETEEPHKHQIVCMLYAMQTGFTNPDFSPQELFVGTQYHPNYLRRVFRQQMGCTPVDYLIHLRIQYAKRLMEENDQLQATISQIAAMAGFRDSYYFSRVFKRKTGVSPSQYIKQSRSK